LAYYSGEGGGDIWTLDLENGGAGTPFLEAPESMSGNRMMSVTIRTDPALEVSAPVELFRGPYFLDGGVDYDVAPDGRFIMLKDASVTEHPSEVVFIEGWFEELRRRVPVQR